MSDEEREELLSEEEEQQEMYEHFRLEADRGQSPIRIDKYLAEHLSDTSRHRVQLAIDAE